MVPIFHPTPRRGGALNSPAAAQHFLHIKPKFQLRWKVANALLSTCHLFGRNTAFIANGTVIDNGKEILVANNRNLKLWEK
ncbi:MAG: hypothetical protein EBR30_29730 [Cytophagia bacterium]|nr:hypothetical protein [Cytophagia bacterium]NBW39126.1 hypothetical protein [Cytophagia bacterium]